MPSRNQRRNRRLINALNNVKVKNDGTQSDDDSIWEVGGVFFPAPSRREPEVQVSSCSVQPEPLQVQVVKVKNDGTQSAESALNLDGAEYSMVEVGGGLFPAPSRREPEVQVSSCSVQPEPLQVQLEPVAESSSVEVTQSQPTLPKEKKVKPIVRFSNVRIIYPDGEELIRHAKMFDGPRIPRYSSAPKKDYSASKTVFRPKDKKKPPTQFPAEANKLVSGISFADALAAKGKSARESAALVPVQSASVQRPSAGTSDSVQRPSAGTSDSFQNPSAESSSAAGQSPRPQPPQSSNPQSSTEHKNSVEKVLGAAKVTTGHQEEPSRAVLFASDVFEMMIKKDDQLSALQTQNNDLQKQLKFLQEKVERMEAMRSGDQEKMSQLETELTGEKAKRQEVEDGIKKEREAKEQLKAELSQKDFQLYENNKKHSLETDRLKTEAATLKQHLDSYKANTDKDLADKTQALQTRREEYRNVEKRSYEMEAALTAEKSKTAKAQVLLTQQTEEVSKLRQTLKETDNALEQERLQQKQEMSRLVSEHQQAEATLKEAETKLQETFHRERQVWTEERSQLLERAASLQEALDKKEEEHRIAAQRILERMTTLEEQMENLGSGNKKKKSKKRSNCLIC